MASLLLGNSSGGGGSRNKNRHWSKKLVRLSSVALLLWMVSSVSSSQAATSFWKDWGVWLLRAGSNKGATATTSNGSKAKNQTRNATTYRAENTSLATDNDGSAVGIEQVIEGDDPQNNGLLPPLFTNSSVEMAPDDIIDQDRKSLWSTSQIMTSKRKQQFLDRIAVLSSSLMRKEQDTASVHVLLDSKKMRDVDLEAVTPQSDLTLPGRHIHIVTTAALPWFTGTAVNPLLRAAYLHRKTQEINRLAAGGKQQQAEQQQQQQQRWVTFVIPWLELPEDQEILYGRVFADSQEQEDFIRAWLREDAGMADAACPETGLEILFYPARYHAGLGSIFAMGDIIETVKASDESSTSTAVAAERQLDVCVLEEPEHCNWYRAPGDGWTKRFNYVIGIVHTNYREYANAHYSGLWTAPAIALMSSAMVRAYCHKVIKLSNTLQSYAVEKESTSNVHGVRSNFWQEGVRRAEHLGSSPWETGTNRSSTTTTEVYFIGKLLWAKGLDLMLELEDYYKQYTGDYFAIDVYGNGPDQRAITRAFHGRRNSVNANPIKEAEIEALEDENDGWDADGGVNEDNSSNLEAEYLSDGELKVALHVKAKQKIAKLKETINSVDIHDKTMEQFAKIKESINSVELPKTFAELRRQPIPATFPGRVDHGELKDYKIFMNPSISEVLCTTTAEALAMGKFAIIPVHPSNTFFLQFPNCLAYRNKFEFVANLRWALTHDPEPLTEEQSRQFTWEAATDRFISASAITWKEALERERLGLAKLDDRIAWFHNEIGKGTTGDLLRKVLGAGPASNQVKYQKEKAVDATRDEDEETGDSEEEEDESGFSRKFRRSSFARAISAALGDISSFGIQ